MKFVSLVLAASFCALSSVAYAQDVSDVDENVFVMGGPFAVDTFADALTPWDNTYESNFFAGGGYQRFLYAHESGFKLGVEAGLGLRAGYRASAEVWGGVVARAEMFQVGEISITPSVTFGLSLTTDTIGVETERAERLGHAVPILYYFSPEIAVAHADAPNYEGFVRLQHRSGGFGTIADIDASNAVVLGLRYKF